MICTEWFQGHEVEEKQSTVLPMPFWLCLVAVALILIQGCATTEPESKVCFMQLMGRTQSGLSVVRQACMTEEQFAESQK